MPRRLRVATVGSWVGGVSLLVFAASCNPAFVDLFATSTTGSTASSLQLFNPTLINTLSGGVVPITPGPGAAFVLVRVKNDTNRPVDFIVTIQRDVLVVNDEGNFVLDDQGNFTTRSFEEDALCLGTTAAGQATEAGVLFPCGESPVTVVGLGRDLLPTDAAIFVGGQGGCSGAGFGVVPAAGTLNPLRLDHGNFNCGDTVIFRAFQSTGAAGGIALQAWVLPGSEQPDIFQGPDTFVNLEEFLAAQDPDGP